MKKEFMKYIILNVVGMIGLSCYILADTFFIAQGLGADGLTALNLAIPVYSFINGTGLMLGMGGATKYSVFRGQGAKQYANEIFTHTLYLALVFSILFMISGIFAVNTLTRILGADEQVYDMTRIYLKVILLFSPAFIFNNVFSCFVRNDGAPGLSMLAMLIGSLSNIVFDYIFIFPMQMGILGAVLATGFAPVIGMMILLVHKLKKNHHFRLQICHVKTDMLGTIFSLGVPSLIIEVAAGIVMIIFNMLILSIAGNIGVAAYGVIANIALVVSSIYNGVAQGMQPLTSRYYGSGEKVYIKKILSYAVRTVVLMSVGIYLFLFVGADMIAAAFNSEQNAELQKMAVEGLKWYFTSTPFVGFNIILSMYFASVEKAVPAQIISLSRGLFLVIPIAFLMAKAAGMQGIWLTIPLTELLVTVFGILLYQRQISCHTSKGCI